MIASINTVGIFSTFGLLAQQSDSPSTPAGPSSGALWIGVILMLVVFYTIIISGNRREKKKRQDMLSAVKKNDRVMTIGGIIGSVVTVSDAEVTLKVDESANVKITFTRSAIQRVLTD
ncbi:MAG: preprotein translocase subunit YajC, partial [Phycisphaerae bacterium]|nr:preprotein translocase subunit YajC [Phycisphaerae bacterium]